MNINISKIEDTLIAKGYLDGVEKELQITGNETINELFEMLANSKTIEEIKIEELEKEKAEIIHENNKLKTSIDELISKYAEFVETKEDYQVDKLYKVGDTFKYNGVVYAVIQEHASMEHWQPDSTPSLYKVLNSTVEAGTDVVIQEWKQPLGSHDAYQLGDKVIFEGKIYESIIANNTWSPTGYPAGWKLGD